MKNKPSVDAALPPHAVQADTPAAWRNWLTEHHAQERGVWLVL